MRGRMMVVVVVMAVMMSMALVRTRSWRVEGVPVSSAGERQHHK